MIINQEPYLFLITLAQQQAMMPIENVERLLAHSLESVIFCIFSH